MAGREVSSLQALPYSWNDAVSPPAETLQLWNEVGNGIDKSQTVVWKSAVDSLDQGNRFLTTVEVARLFVEKYMSPIIGILVEQQPTKIGPHERNCVQESLSSAVSIVARDLDIQVKRRGECKVLDVLALVFNKKKAYYKGNKGNWNVNNFVGLPEVRLKMIDRFRAESGFLYLNRYLEERINTPLFPRLDYLHQILQALGDSINNRAPGGTDQAANAKQIEDDAIATSKAVMKCIGSATDESLKKLPTDQLSTIQYHLQKIFDRLVSSRRLSTYEYYEFWRSLVLKLITSQSLPLKLFGWEQMNELIEASIEHGPPPKSFIVQNAGCTFVNGVYVFSGDTTEDGYAQKGVEISYERRIPDGEEGAGKKLTLFRCTMRSQQKWWFLSEADEEQPGTDRDIDYYQHKSKEHEETHPPPAGWVTSRNAGLEPPPNLRPAGLLVPAGEETNTLEHQLAKWAIENGIIEHVLGNSVHREVVARSTPLIKFLASMCEKYSTSEIVEEPKRFCLQTSHLLLAWKTCTRKTDEAVSAQVYQLLVSILPSCPSSLAIPLLEAVQTSLGQGDDKREYLVEVSDFCSALAAANFAEVKAGANVALLSDDVREQVLNLLWAVLTHPDASSLKTYENLKRYVTNELRVEPKGSEHREKFLKACIEDLTESASQRSGTNFNEVQALRMVKLTRFVLAACPREQANEFVTKSSGALPVLLFNDLAAYLERKASRIKKGVARNDSAASLQERLRILRYVYGLSTVILMDGQQLRSLWSLCTSPTDREEFMVFLASASNTSIPTAGNPTPASTNLSSPNQPVPADEMLSVAFSEEVCSGVFVDLFCAPDLSYDELGEAAYTSFQFMFNRYRVVSGSSHAASGAALDALWRISLTAGNSAVASQAMKDLLAVYSSIGTTNSENGWSAKDADSAGQMVMEDSNASFADRVFDCLAMVKRSLDERLPGAERSAQRCLSILNAAIGQSGYAPASTMAFSTLSRLSSLPNDSTLDSVMKYLPHGLRGQACYRRIGVMAKRAWLHNQSDKGPQVYQSVDDVSASTGAASKSPSSLRFSLEVHPLETLASVKFKVAAYCQCAVGSVKPVSVSGRLPSRTQGDGQMSLNVVPDDSVIDELGIGQGSEVVFQIVERQTQVNPASTAAKMMNYTRSRDLSDMFFDSDAQFSDKLFLTLLEVLGSLPNRQDSVMGNLADADKDTPKLVWDLLLSIPTNAKIERRVRACSSINLGERDDDAMDLDVPGDSWSMILDRKNFHRSVYCLLAIDALLQPAIEVLSILPTEQRLVIERSMQDDAANFRKNLIESGGFDAIVRFFSESEGNPSKTRMGNAVALRILKCCLFGNNRLTRGPSDMSSSAGAPDEAGSRLLQALSDAEGLLRSLTSMVVGDSGISTATISDVLKFLRLLFRSQNTAQSFVSLPNGMAEEFLITLLMWEGGPDVVRNAASIGLAAKVRESTHDLILHTPLLADNALPWLIRALDKIEVTSDSTADYFDVLQKLVSGDMETAKSKSASERELKDLGTSVCKKIACCPRPTNETALFDFSTGVLCGCLSLLRALIETGGGNVLKEGTDILVDVLGVQQWSEMIGSSNKGMLFGISLSLTGSGLKNDDGALIDLMGAIFDGFLSPGGSTSVVAICCDKRSRQRGFDVVGAAARSCKGGDGYLALVARINQLVESAAPYVRHRWGQVGTSTDGQSRTGRNTSKYSGLRNQGCTCYMNSVLQQMFMMPELRNSLCAAPLPSKLRSTGGVISSKGHELVGKKVSMQWESGVSYDAIVEAFNAGSGMHTIRYCPMQVAVTGTSHDQVKPQDIARLPPPLPDEFFLSEGRPGKETGVFEVVSNVVNAAGESTGEVPMDSSTGEEIVEKEDEMTSRHLLEEVQRTFIHLDEGSRGRCFDPRALVEACACLKLEFDVWQQNDASEFATKLLDRMEISLKKWAPSSFRYLDHTFGIKQTKQKICKECGLKTNREEKLMNIDCQIRGKADVHEALAAMTEVEIMEGNNKVSCDRCKKKTDTVLKTAISSLPNMMVLSLKRFDLDYNTFETVKLNSRCAFGQTLNMKRYTLEAVEAMEQAANGEDTGGVSPMDTTGSPETAAAAADPLRSLPDEDYEYRLAGVLVHAGVAQGGHYYSFINDRNVGSKDQWYRFDDEDVTPFDPALIETECFGGKVKKEQKWPNGQVHTVESEQYANALMLFYEKVKPSEVPPVDAKEAGKEASMPLVKSSGYDVFEADVRRSNATHRWQTFLFDSDFQIFMKGMLGLCRLSSADPASPAASAVSTGNSWRASVVQMLLGFVFDIMFYSSERFALNDWVKMLEETFAADSYIAQEFVHKLARRTREVSANWLRTYLLECPDQVARNAAVRIFSAAIHSCLSSEEELRALSNWTQAWDAEISSFAQGPTALPCSLIGQWGSLENVDAVGGGEASSLGIIFSQVNALIEATPRAARYSPELSSFIRYLASINSESVGRILKMAIIKSLIPSRLMCLVLRHRAPLQMKTAFPGASCSVEVAETQIRTVSSPVAHVMPLSGNHVMTAPESTARGHGAPAPSDYLSLFEALGCLAGLRGVLHVPLTWETEDTPRGRPRVVLSKGAVAALTTVFQESCAPSAIGMGQREIELYLQRCGVDSASVPPQKIVDIMAKYPTTQAGSGKGTSYLSLEGFLAYYRDTAHRIRSDLHVFGFRPDLSRRPFETRILVKGDLEQPRSNAESIGLDVATTLKNSGGAYLGPLGEYATDCFQLFEVAYLASDHLGEYLVAGTAYLRDSEALIVSTLKAIYHAPTGWGASETLHAAVMVLGVLASIPDDRQQARISYIMQATEKPSHKADHGVGLLACAQAFYGSRSPQHYPSGGHFAYERYVSILKELMTLNVILKWLYNNRSRWSWMERDLADPHAPAPHHTHMRGGYSIGRELDTSSFNSSLPHHSDSDVPVMNDSEDDDDGSEMETLYTDVTGSILVEAAGHPDVNGLYTRDGFFEGAGKYSMQGKHKNENCTFSLFQCSVSNNTKHWYISIVPRNSQPGTSTDIDFYSAPVTDSCKEIPPESTWTKSNEGRNPPPTLVRNAGNDNTRRRGQLWNKREGEDRNHGGQTYI